MDTLPWWGYALLSAFFAALTTIFAKIGVNQVSSNLATAIRTAIIIVIVWGIVFVTGEVRAINSVSRTAWIFLTLSAAATGLSWLFYFKALQMGKASYVAPIDKSSIAMVVLLSVIFLHEPLTWKSALGTLAILGGMLLFLF
ncbi:MAG: EamA family transporter [Caldilineaceae bacterium]|nr:EamA family transporter [Caldilineaceae bacterium]